MASKDSELIRGFQLMAAYHHKGTFNNTSYHALSRTTKFTDDNQNDWDVLTDADWEERKFEKSATGMYKLLMQFDYFLRLQQWGFSINDMLSDGATIGFYVGLIKHWEQIGEPTSKASQAGTLFGKNAYILFDKLIREVMLGQWGGAGDSAAGILIRKLDKHPAKLLPKVSDDDWIKVWTQFVCGNGSFKDSNTCCKKPTHNSEKTDSKTGVTTPACPHKLTEGMLPNGKIVSKKKDSQSKKQSIPAWVKKLMIHYYCTCGIESFKVTDVTYKDAKIHWDHIIPDSKFTAGSDEALFCNNIGNTCALPDHENIMKSSKLLTHSDCQKGSTKMMIERFSELNLATDATKYDDSKKARALILTRGQLLMDNFINKRAGLM